MGEKSLEEDICKIEADILATRLFYVTSSLLSQMIEILKHKNCIDYSPSRRTDKQYQIFKQHYLYLVFVH